MNRLLFKIYNEENAHYYLENTGKIQKMYFAYYVEKQTFLANTKELCHTEK